MPRFAANLSMMFTEMPFLDRFAAASQAGFKAVEYLFPYDYRPDAIAAALRRNGLQQALFNIPAGNFAKGDRGLAALEERREEFDHSLQIALSYARDIGAPKLHLMAGITERNEKTVAVYRESVLRAADAAEKFGIGILIEPINGFDMPGYFLNDFDWAADFIEKLAHPNVQLQFDIYHCQILHGNLHRNLERLMSLIGHIQVASIPHRNEPGTGELNEAYLFQLIDNLGYTGYVGCEYKPLSETLEGLGWFARWRT
ncbi:2-oxo-tetronate isomerase [Brucella intermedia]|uniref:2-oxo-tetronate isomerase n=1 Tax=Brucella intermedia TaxID=94625 RepID=UPI00224A5E91|nr:2-oxo-tetronate isomerase [Brucella intermedia]